MPDKRHALINRELSWLAFNQRVLEQAQDTSLPLLERLKFLAITGSNLDEFFMVRVGGLQQLLAHKQNAPDPSGLTPAEQLAEISNIVHQMMEAQYRILLNDLEIKLAAENIRRMTVAQLTPEQDVYIEWLFEHELYPVVTPIAVDLEESFPRLPGLGINVCVRLSPVKGNDNPRFAVIAIPRGLARFVTIPAEQSYQYLLLEDIITAFLPRIFPGETLVESAPFRITRNADMGVREDAASDLLEQMKEVLTERKQSNCVRLEIGQRASPTLRGFLKSTLDVEDKSIYIAPGALGLSAYARIANMAGFGALQLEAWTPQPSPDAPAAESIFDAISRGDMLLYHPYESFDPVQRLVEEAANDPNVLAIKQILYRTSENSPIVGALARAAEKDKHVTVLVELKARFDEERNIEWATALEQAGVQVIYGLKGLKTHAKICIVVRREAGGGIRRYVHFGTGNYNEKTACVYSDISFLTCNEDLGADASTFFNTITGYSQPVNFRKIEAAPLGLRARVLELIENEMERKKQGHEAQIMVKLNSLADPDLIEALYRASKAGVPVRLNVRGICCLRPAQEGLSDTISVVSIVDRFLEHSRILYFHNGGNPQVFISSADWMPRNLDRRVELLVPVEDARCQKRLIGILETCFQDNVQAWRLHSDGRYQRISAGRKKPLRSQESFYLMACEAARTARKAGDNVFEPQRPVGAER